MLDVGRAAVMWLKGDQTPGIRASKGGCLALSDDQRLFLSNDQPSHDPHALMRSLRRRKTEAVNAAVSFPAPYR